MRPKGAQFTQIDGRGKSVSLGDIAPVFPRLGTTTQDKLALLPLLAMAMFGMV